MGKQKRVLFWGFSVIYGVIYILTISLDAYFLSSILRPVASLLALFSMIAYVRMKEDHYRAHRTMVFGLGILFLVDLFVAASEVNLFFNPDQGNPLFQFQFIAYLLVRVCILIATVQMYLGVTWHTDRFLRFTDFFTMVCCIISTFWIITFSFDQDVILYHFIGADDFLFFAELFRIIAMLILGAMLMAWFHYQYRLLTLGQRLMQLGLVLFGLTDLAKEFSFSAGMDKGIEIAYVFAIFCVAIGGSTFDLFLQKTPFIQQRDGMEKLKHSWKNVGYLFIFPLISYLYVGKRMEMFVYIFLFAFYLLGCKYVLQLAITSELLTSEKIKNDQLQLYSGVVEQTALSIIVTNPEGKIEYVNPYFSQISGYSFEEVKGKDPSNFLVKSSSDHFPIQLWQQLKRGEKWSGEFYNRTKSGEEYKERSVLFPIYNDEKKLSHYVAIKENISETEQLKMHINEQEQFIDQLSDLIPSAIFQISKDDIFLGSNKEYSRVYEQDAKKYIGKKIKDLPWMTPERYALFLTIKEEALSSKKTVTKQIERKVGEREIPILYTVNAYYNSKHEIMGIIGIMTDISPIKEKEEALSVALKEAEAATEAKSVFLANMSHEIRTPMNAIIGMSYLALKTNLNQQQRDYVEKINHASSSLLGIINEILDFSKIEAGRMELEEKEFSLDEIVSKSIELTVEKAREKNLDVLYHQENDIPNYLIGDPLRLGQIITNLASNGVKFTKQGEVLIKIQKQEERQNKIKLLFTIADTGIGLSMENQQHLFDAFTQSDSSITREFGGTGLGLAISKQIVELMEGEIWVESQIGKGSTFSFTAWFKKSSKQKKETKRSLVTIRGKQALIVDDNENSREILKEYATCLGFEVECAISGMEALYKVRERDESNPFEILFVDWKMPELDGVEMVRRIVEKEKLINRPSVVMVTAYDKEEMRKYAKGLPVHGFLTKPVTQSCLYEAVVDIYGHEEEDKQEKQEKQENTNFTSSVIKRQELSSIADKPTQIEDIPSRKKRFEGVKLLLVEDNLMNQQIGKELLESQGAKVYIANHGQEAIFMYQEKKDEIKAILMDIQMPKMDGLTATRKIREISKEIPIIAMTARTLPGEKQLCVSAGMNDHIPKPVDPEVLYSTLDRWLDSNNEIDHTLTKDSLIDSLIYLLELGDITSIDFVHNNRQEFAQLIGVGNLGLLIIKLRAFEFEEAVRLLEGLDIRG